MLINITDFSTVCSDYEIEQLTALGEELQIAERAALEQMASYLRHRYDTEKAFSATGEERNPMLVQCAVNITLWLLIHRLPQNMGHERRECLYNDAIKWLRDVQNSKASPDLPTYTDPDDPDDPDAGNPVRCGSMSPNYYLY